jgi:hypothetical protein
LIPVVNKSQRFQKPSPYFNQCTIGNSSSFLKEPDPYMSYETASRLSLLKRVAAIA